MTPLKLVCPTPALARPWRDDISKCLASASLLSGQARLHYRIVAFCAHEVAFLVLLASFSCLGHHENPRRDPVGPVRRRHRTPLTKLSSLRWEATISKCGSLAELQQAVKSNGSSSPCLSGCRSLCWKVCRTDLSWETLRY